MIAMAESVSHGCNTLRYITGETPNKEHPERVYHICNNLMENGLDARGMWDSFKLTLARHGKNGRLKNSVVSFVISPPPDKVKYYNPEDWEQLGREYLAIYDKIELRNERGKVYSEPTNILSSKFTMWLHKDSDSGVPHLHVAALRIDQKGKTNNDHQILQRAQHAAEVLAHKRGWMSAKEIREDNLIDVEGNCVKVLENMRTFSLDAYFNALRSLDEDYTVETKRDSNNNYVSYVICDGNKRYPASHIGKSRKYTVAHLEETWRKLYNQRIAKVREQLWRSEQEREKDFEARLAARKASNHAKPLQQQSTTPVQKVQKPSTNVAPPVSPKPTIVKADTQRRSAAPVASRDYTQRGPDTTWYDYRDDNNKTTRYYLPNKVMDFFNEEFDYKTIRNWDDLMRLAVGVFVGVVMGPEEQPTIGTGGGGPTSDLPWRDKDEDDLRWACRCAHYATRKLGKTKKSGLSR